jgi:hypothetical protein
MRKSKLGCLKMSFILGLVTVLAGPSASSAQEPADRTGHYRRPPLRVDVTPAPVRLGRYFRQCSDGPVIERRATGDTIVPSISCWWAVH